MPTSPEVLASLNTDLAMEHGAIMQYVIHSVALRDTTLAETVKRTAREEMWHFEWLNEAIRDRGGTPTLDRADVFTTPSLLEAMRVDVDTEQGALDHYARTLALIGDSDPDLSALIGRIVADERHHKSAFARLAETIAGDGEAAFTATPKIAPADLGVVGPTVGAEYLGILTYLRNKYGCGDCGRGEEYFDLAIDEMRHAGWAAGYTAGMGAAPAPPVPAEKLGPVSSVDDADAAARTLEGFSAGFYAEKIAAAGNPDLKADLERAAAQHAYHRYLLGDGG